VFHVSHFFHPLSWGCVCVCVCLSEREGNKYLLEGRKLAGWSRRGRVLTTRKGSNPNLFLLKEETGEGEKIYVWNIWSCSPLRMVGCMILIFTILPFLGQNKTIANLMRRKIEKLTYSICLSK
jgi:hypothetical protein